MIDENAQKKHFPSVGIGHLAHLNRASSSHTAVGKNEAQPNRVQFSMSFGPHSAPLLWQEPNGARKCWAQLRMS